MDKKEKLLHAWKFCKLRGYCTPNQKLACFVLSLKIINPFLQKIIYASYSKLSKELKNGIKMLEGKRF